MKIVYAALSQQHNISGSAKVQSKSESWNIHFQHITNTANEVAVEQYATVQSSSISLTDTNTTATLPTVTFKAPGDKVTYLFDVINEGDITGYINVINDINIPDVSGAEIYKSAIIKTFTYADDTPIAVNNSIAKNEVKHLKVTLQLSSDLETLPNAEVTFSNITASLVYGQDTVSGGNSGSGGNEPVTPSNPYETTFNGTYGYDYDGADTLSNGGSSEWVSTLEPNAEAYLRNDGTKIEVCGAFGSGQTGTVCLTGASNISGYSSDDGYASDFEDVSNNTKNITTIAGLEATGLKGYSLAKAEEMLTKGASSCNVKTRYVDCNMTSGGSCSISDGGDVDCSDGDYSPIVYTDGSTDNHSAP
jgi:hypothetical protein